MFALVELDLVVVLWLLLLTVECCLALVFFFQCDVLCLIRTCFEIVLLFVSFKDRFFVLS